MQCTKDDVTLNNYIARSRTACSCLAALASQTCGLKPDQLEVWCPSICPEEHQAHRRREGDQAEKEKKAKSDKKEKSDSKRSKKTKKDKK